MTNNCTHYVWDLTGNSRTSDVYAVSYRATSDRITVAERERAIDKARRIATERTGNRRCMLQTNDAAEPYCGHGGIVGVPLTTRPLAAWRGRSRQTLAAFEFGDEWDYQDLLDALAIRMSGNKHWRIDGHNIDWRGRSGSKFALAETARDLLHAIYVEDIVRVYRGRRSGQLEINAPTHDTPTGSFYTFTPIAKRTYQRLA